MKLLIVNADDLGADESRNAGIFEAVEAGVVASVSVLVNGRAFHSAVQRTIASHYPISLGVHLNISEGKPLSAGLKSIAGRDGCFLGKAETHRRLLNSGDENLRKEIRREFRAQIAALLETGAFVDHLDGHQHVHVFPAAIEEAVEAAKEFDIRWIRIPEEPAPSGLLREASVALSGEAAAFSRKAAQARAAAAGAPFKTADHFRGLYLKGLLSLELLREILQTLPPGLTELMVHPGHAPGEGKPDLFAPFSNPQRERELRVLKDSRFRSMLEEFEIQLSRFPGACS